MYYSLWGLKNFEVWLTYSKLQIYKSVHFGIFWNACILIKPSPPQKPLCPFIISLSCFPTPLLSTPRQPHLLSFIIDYICPLEFVGVGSRTTQVYQSRTYSSWNPHAWKCHSVVFASHECCIFDWRLAEKKSVYKWTRAVHPCVVQGSAVVCIF